jgi:hypothetical protein
MKKFLNVLINEDLHVEFKVLVAKRKSTMEKVLDEAIKDIIQKYKDQEESK